MNKEKRIQLILNSTIAATGILTFISWYFYLNISPISEALWTALYRTIQTFMMDAELNIHPIPFLLKISTLIAPLSLASSLIFRMIKHARLRFFGFLISSSYRDHIIIAGNLEFCKALIRRGEKIDKKIVILLSEEYEKQQYMLDSYKVFTLCSNLFSSRTWKWAGLLHADNLVLSPGYFDFLDEIKLALKPILDKRKKKGYSELIVNYALSTQKQKEIFSDSKTWFNDTNMDAHSLQFENMAACGVAVDYAPHHYLAPEILEQEAPHLLIDGFTDFCGWFILEAAQLYHYPSFKKLRISLITDKDEEVRKFQNLFPGLPFVIDLEVFRKREIIQTLHFAEDNLFKEGPMPHMCFCFPDDPWDIPSNARLWRRYLTQMKGGPSTEPLVFFIPEGCQTPDTFKNFPSEWNSLLFTVHVPEDFVTLEQILENRVVIDGIAKEIHEIYCENSSNTPPWNMLSDTEKDSSRKSARHLILKLNLMGYSLSEKPGTETMPLPQFSVEQKSLFSRLEHNRWNAEKLLDHFVPGVFPGDKVLKDLYKNTYRIHQDIRPFNELTASDIAKDEATFQNLEKLLNRVSPTHKLVRFQRKKEQQIPLNLN